MEFRRGVLDAVSRVSGQPAREHFERWSAVKIAKALRWVAPNNDQSVDLERAVRCLLFDLWSGMPILDNEIESRLDGTWAGGVLAGMKEHHRERVAAQRAHEEFQQGAQRRREEKKRLKQEQHQARLALKRERDRLWHEKQGKSD